MKTIAIVVGVSNYQDPSFESLPGAQADAHRFSSALISWGVSKTGVHLLLNEKATKATLTHIFSSCELTCDADMKLIFYFAGHGTRENAFNQPMPESSLVLYDTESANPLSTGLRLVDLMHLIRTIKPTQVFLFIDACNLRLNQIENPLNHGDILSKTNSKGFFCLLSSGVHQSYEDCEFGYGYFTNALLKALSKLRHEAEPDCHDIVEMTSAILREQSLPLPEVYYIGLENMWPLGASREDKQSTSVDDRVVWRRHALSSLQDHLIKLPDPILWIWGEEGMGKSMIVEQMRQENPCTLYVSIPHSGRPQQAINQMIGQEVRKQIKELFLNEPTYLTLAHTLRHIAQKKPGYLLMIDHLNYLNLVDLENLLREIDCVHIPCVLISCYPCPEKIFKQRKSQIISWNVAAMNAQEIEEMLLKNDLDPVFSHAIHTATGGHPLKVRHMLAKMRETYHHLSHQDVMQEYERTLAALSICGGFLDEELFRKTFNIKPAILSILERLGLIRYSKEGCFPHDILLEMVEEHEWPLEIEKACEYWSRQVVRTPYSLFACRSLVILASQSIEPTHFKRSLTLCLSTLHSREHVPYLKDLIKIFVEANWQDLLLKLVDYLVDFEEFTLVEEILPFLMASPVNGIRNEAYRINAKRLIWVNRLDECIHVNQSIVKKNRSPAVASIKLDMGIAYFLLGEWPQAKEIAQDILDQEGHLDWKEIGVAKCLLGTILGLSGESVSKSKRLIEASMRIFEAIKDPLWLSISQNNSGEILWKTGQYRQSLFFLEKAYEGAEKLQHKIFLLEVLRNMAHAHLYLYGPSSLELNNLLSKIYDCLIDVEQRGDNWEKIKLLNTLTTVHAYRWENSRMEDLLETLIPLTINHKHHYILTLANQGLLAGLKQDYRLANSYAKQAFERAYAINNPLVVEQIKRDFKNCSIDLLDDEEEGEEMSKQIVDDNICLSPGLCFCCSFMERRENQMLLKFT
jgi:tetratricopeptide (TPR) repeat protein